MKHADEETLVLLALGEAPDPGDELHLQSCSTCRRELETLRCVVTTAHAPAPDESDLLEPPVGLWADIADELGLADASLDSDPVEDESRTITARAAVEPASEGAGPTPGRPRRPRLPRRTRFAVALAACAALLGAAAGSAVTWWATRDDTGATTAGGRPLDSLRAASTGYASLRGTQTHRSLTVQVKGLPSTSGYFEVWLMNRTHTKLVSVGVLNPDGHAILPVPENIDLNEYSVVDVSVQPYNGKPAHSGKSIVRGPYSG